jgi:hypothetical protein
MLGELPAIDFNRQAQPIDLIAFAYGHLNALNSLLEEIMESPRGSPMAAAAITLTKPAIEALFEATELIRAAPLSNG